MEETDYHQKLMNQAYEKWFTDKDGRSEPMKVWFKKLTDLEKDAVALGKFNQQVCNGGFSQWVGNGYMKVQFVQLQQAIIRLPECEVVIAVNEILNKFEEIAQNNEWGEGSYTENNPEECCECNGTGYIESKEDEEVSCEYCNDGEVDCDEDIFYEDQLCEDLHSHDLDSKYYKLDQEFLKVCEEYFKKCLTTKFEPDYESKETKIVRIEKPKVKLLGEDGNVFVILGSVQKVLINSNWSHKEIQDVMDEMKQGDYDHVLRTAMKYCEVY